MEILLPGAPGYEAARKPALARFDGIRPQAIARCASPEDVAAALAHARRSGMRVAVRSGGHCFAGRSSTTGLLIDVAPMDSVSVAGGVATVGAGTRLAALYDALDRHGVTLPLGCGPTVGIAGLTLGGGVGVLGRRYGLTCDRLLAARVVLADGHVVDCDAEQEPDLFWALRGGGGGQFGIVASFTFDPVPATPATRFHVVWPYGAAAGVIDAWQRWAPDAPDAMNASLKVAAEVHLFGLHLGDRRETAALLGQMAAAEPASTSLRHLPYRAAKQSLVGVGAPEEEGPALVFSKSELFDRPLPPDAIAALVDGLATGRAPGETRELNFTPLGGAYSRVPADATAFAHRDARFLLEHVQAPGHAWAMRSWATAHPHGTGRVYPNFPDPELPPWDEAYHAGNRERLLRVKRAYDPENVFRVVES